MITVLLQQGKIQNVIIYLSSTVKSMWACIKFIVMQ